MGDLILLAAEHLAIWRPFAIAALSGVVLGCLWYAVTAWEASR